MLCGCEYVLEHTLVCVHPALIENKGLIESGTMKYTQCSCTLDTYMLQTMERQYIEAYVEHKVTVVLSLGAPSALYPWPWVFPHNVLL